VKATTIDAMRIALDEARAAGRRGEVPIGAVVVRDVPPEARVKGVPAR